MVPRVQVIPLDGHRLMLSCDGRTITAWHFGDSYPRPFLFPVNGPSGQSLTRMGHPGAANHDHHRSIWFAHEKVLGINFWADNTPARIRQERWLAMRDGDDSAAFAVRLNWLDGHDPAPLIRQDLIVSFHPREQGEYLLDLQCEFTPAADELELGQSHFGFLAIRVARSISEYFGGGRISDSEGRTGEPTIFGNESRWMDYSGPVLNEPTGDAVIEGLTCFPHPSNPGAPNRWHVREDGWMGPSHCRLQPYLLKRDAPLLLRYRLHVHRGGYDERRSAAIERDFADSQPMEVVASGRPHTEFEIRSAGD